AKSVFNFVFKYLHGGVNRVIAGSCDGKDQIALDYGFDKEKISITYYGAGSAIMPLNKNESRIKVRELYKISNPFILTVGRLQPHKNIEGLIKAYLRMRLTTKISHSLVIIAKPSENAESAYRLARESRYNNDIHFISYVSEKNLN